MDNQNIEALLTEIRDTHRQQLEEYRRIAGEALVLQKQSIEQQLHAIAQQKTAVEAQARYLRLFRIVLLVVTPLIAYLVWSLVKHL